MIINNEYHEYSYEEKKWVPVHQREYRYDRSPKTPRPESWEDIEAVDDYGRFEDEEFDFEEMAGRIERARKADDDAKIEKHREQARLELEQAITAAGEAGWRSQFYTGPSHEADLLSLQIYPYQQWRLARGDYVRTGDEKYKEAMLKVVDFDNPPEASAVKIRVPEPAPVKRAKREISPAQAWRAAKRTAKTSPLAVVGIAYMAALVILTVLMSVL